jgi:carbohydrate-binding DOMON domain-containing protein
VDKKESIHVLPKIEMVTPSVIETKAPTNPPKESGYSAFIAEKKIELSSQYTPPTYAQPTSLYSLPKPNFTAQSYGKFNETYYATATATPS